MTKRIKAGQTVRVIGNGYNTCQPIGWVSKVICGTTFLGTDGKEHMADCVTIISATGGLISMDTAHVEIVPFAGLCES